MAEAALKISREYGDSMATERLALADRTRNDVYRRKITEEERNSFNQEIVDLSVEEHRLTADKKETMKSFTDDIKKKRTLINENLNRVTSGNMEVADLISVFFDHDNLKVHEYNSKGERTLTRRMKPNEAQTEISE